MQKVEEGGRRSKKSNGMKKLKQIFCTHDYNFWDRNVVKRDVVYRIYRCRKCQQEVAVKADET